MHLHTSSELETTAWSEQLLQYPFRHIPAALAVQQIAILRLHLAPDALQLFSTSLTLIPFVIVWITRVHDGQLRRAREILWIIPTISSAASTCMYTSKS